MHRRSNAAEEKRVLFLLQSLKHLPLHEQMLFGRASMCSGAGNGSDPCQQAADDDCEQLKRDNYRDPSTPARGSNVLSTSSTKVMPHDVINSPLQQCQCIAEDVCVSCRTTPGSLTDRNELIQCDFLFRPQCDLPAMIFQQTYRKWKMTMDSVRRLRLLRSRRAIYIQPIGTFPEFMTTEFFEILQQYVHAFFHGMEARLVLSLHTAEQDWRIRDRVHHITGQRQILVGDVHKGLAKLLPADAYCMVGVCWTDLYPEDKLNFVLGEASFSKRVAAMCFGRYEPKSYASGSPPASLDRLTGDLLWRVTKVLSHELCHVFGVAHCVFFSCMMNESGSLKEAAPQPNFLCPVCLYKLKKCTKFDVVTRYRSLLDFYQSQNLFVECAPAQSAMVWLRSMIFWLTSDAS